jgi:hypothetical protein
MTITTSQLDELERRAIALTDAPVIFHKAESGSEDERCAERAWRRAAEDFRDAATPAAIHQLVAIARAALALVGPARVSDAHLPEFNALIVALRGTP